MDRIDLKFDNAYIDGKKVIEVLDTWCVVDKWWSGHEERIERTYAELLLENGDRVVMVHEKGQSAWHRMQ